VRRTKKNIHSEEQRAKQVEQLHAISVELGVPLEEVYDRLMQLLDRKFPPPNYYQFSAN
jgi:hypothetical protein